MSDADITLLDTQAAEVLWHPEIEQFTLAMIEAATTRLYVAQFIAAATVRSDRTRRVDELIRAIARAHVRGVDVRVLLSPFRTDDDPFDVNEVAAALLADHGVPVRTWSDAYRSSMHSKYVVLDDECVLIGSANWSNGGLGGNIESAVTAWSAGTARLLASRFRSHWRRALTIESIE